MSIFKSHHSRKMKSDELYDNKKEVPQEDYTSAGKLEISKTQRIISGLQIIFGGCLSACGIMLYKQFPSIMNTGILALGIAIALFGCLSLYWSVRDTQLIQQQLNKEQWYNTSDHALSRLLFTSSIIKTVLLFTLMVTLIIFKDTVHDYFIANQTQQQTAQSIEDEYNKYRMYVQITFAIGCANMITLLWTTFSSFAFSNSATAFRLSLYLFTLITLTLCGALVYVTFSSKYLENIHSLQQIADLWAIRVLFYISVVYILTLLAILITNFSKSMNFYMSVGTLLLLVCIVLVSFNGKIYRNAKQINGFAAQNCQNEMQMIHQDYLQIAGCPNKYIPREENSLYPNCEMSSQAVQWENDLKKDNVNKVNAIQCLNTKCCALAGQVYSDWFYLIATLGQLISLFSFVIIGMCYYLSSRYSGNSLFFKKIECVFLMLSIIVLTTWTMLIIYKEYQPISQKPGILAELKEPNYNSDTYQLFTYADVTKRVECEKSFSQFFQIYYNKQFSKNQLFDCLDDQCTKTILRISVTTTYYKIIVSESYNDPSVKIFDSRYAVVFNNENILEFQDFIAAEGPISAIKSFFLQNVCLYSYEPQANHNMIVRASKVNSDTKRTENSIVFKPSKQTLKELNEQKRRSEMSYSQPFNEDREKNLEGNISFESVVINVKDATTDEDIKDKEVTLKVYFHHNECIEQTSPPQLELRGKQSTFLVQNQYSNTYTIFVKVEGYNYSCKRVYLTERFKTTSQIVYMNPKLKNNEIRVVLEWSTHTVAQLDLLATLQTDKQVDCIVGYLNENCQKIFYERKSSHPYYQSIKIDKLGANNYLFYIKHNLSQRQYLDLIASGKNNINQILAESGAHFSIYVAGLEYPVFESGIGYFDNKYSQETNLVWLVACMNGTYGNQVHTLNQYWSTKSANDYILKQTDQQLPPGEICEKYIQSLYN